MDVRQSVAASGLYTGDCRLILPELAAGGVKAQTCITSPPYYGLRDYGCAGQIGLEPTVAEYVDNLVQVFRLVRDVLADDGTLWLNLGDSYAGSGKGRNADGSPFAGHQDSFQTATQLKGHCCKVSDEAAFCLIQRPYISKTLLTRRISPRGSP